MSRDELAANALPEPGRGREPHHVWIEAETLAPLRGGNFSFQKEDQQARGTWAVGGPDVAASWMQGGESEWMQIAARSDETNEVRAERDVEIPARQNILTGVQP
ncbi:MAG: hypothetical protein ACR2OZ_13220 [Verrucomicrobiales bacterium]